MFWIFVPKLYLRLLLNELFGLQALIYLVSGTKRVARPNLPPPNGRREKIMLKELAVFEKKRC